MIELLRTKLFIPRPRKNLVSRPRLVDCLNEGLEKKLTLVAAPAGFGKTTLLSEWIPQSPRGVTWFSLDHDDNDPTRFWAYFIQSLQGLRKELGEGASSLLQSPQALPITAILTTLVNDITVFPDSFTIVLDDYHVIESQPIHDGLTFLIEHQPVNMHLLITTRMDPPLPLARLRARDQLTELRANDLRFTVGETTAFLNRMMGLNLSPEEVTALEARTEGWIAGLQIAALSMQGHDDVSGFVRAFSGSHRHIIGYLAEEILNQQPKATSDFLLQTSILDQLCGPLCDAVTGQADGHSILAELEHSNLFIMPLDETGTWYRYHHLFAEVLRARLQQTRPNLLRDLHRRASIWHEQNGRLAYAVSHALAAQDFDQAAHLVEQASTAMWQRGEVKTLLNWLAALPSDIRHAHPQLCLAQAWSEFATGQITMVETSIREAEAAIDSWTEAEVEPLRAQVDALRSTLAGFQQDSAKAIELASRALEYLPEKDQFLRGLIAFSLGRVYLLQGNISAGRQTLREAAAFSLNAGDLSTASFALNALGAELEVHGQLRNAAQCFRQVIEAVQQDGKTLAVPAASGAYVWLSRILYEWDQLEEAVQSANQGIELSLPFQAGGAMFVGYFVLANILRVRGDFSGSFDLLQKAESVLRSDPTLKIALRMVEAARAQLFLAQGNISAAKQWAASYARELNFPASGSWPGVRQFYPMLDYECLTLVRVRMAQAQMEEALSLLTQLKQLVENGDRKRGLIQLLCLSALIFRAQANNAEAMAGLKVALSLAEPEGYIRIFADEGEPMRLLLLEYQSQIKKQMSDRVDSDSLRLLTYTDKLLAAFAQPVTSEYSKAGLLAESLSERELDILRLIAAGRSNQEIAEILVIAVSTVKSHINNLYGKLGTNRRTEAIVIARERGLLSE